jgi:hypothetical protein
MSRSACCQDEAAQEEAQPGPKSHQAPGRSNGALFGARWLGRLWRDASARKFPGQRLLRIQSLGPSHPTLLSQDTSAFGPCLLFSSTFGERSAGPHQRNRMVGYWPGLVSRDHGRPPSLVECVGEVLVARGSACVYVACVGVVCWCCSCECACCWPSCCFNICLLKCACEEGLADCSAMQLQRAGEVN